MKRTYNPGVTKCAGTCGRMLRSSRHTLKQVPGTVRRYANNMCHRCDSMAGQKAKELAQAIRPCRNCDHPTRPARMSFLEAPGTRNRIGELCQRCDVSCEWVKPEQVTAAVQSLDAYIRARRARGIPPEGLGHKTDMELAS